MPIIKSRLSPIKIQQQLEQQGTPSLLARLYAARGVTHKKELEYELTHLLAPTELLGVQNAAILLANALEAQARLLVVADYDCDGATACAVAIRALRAMAYNDEACAHILYLVPDRFTYGYGLSPEIVDLAATQKPDLIITVDNGIASITGVARANELGITTLITDHHLPAEHLPDAECIVNPNQPNCPFPSKHLAGVGVIFYVMLALRSELRERGWFTTERPEPNLAKLLDLVALGTVADVVRLDHNNRLLVSQGLKRIREGKLSAGLAALFKLTSRDPTYASNLDLGFIIGPRLNAAGRLTDMSIGIECLLSDDYAHALSLAQQLDSLNRERKEIESEMQEQALLLLENLATPDVPALALFDPSWHQGVIGILASRLKDRLHRPVFAFAPSDNGEIKGSGRSIQGFHLRDALDLIAKRAPNLLLRFGGHAMAAGLTMHADDFATFQTLFAKVANELLSPAELTHIIETDGALDNSQISLYTAKTLEDGIWGQGFPAPLFADTFTIEQQRILKEKHLKMRLQKDNQLFDAIWFNFLKAPESKHIRAVYRLATNSFNGIESVQLIIDYLEDVKNGE